MKILIQNRFYPIVKSVLYDFVKKNYMSPDGTLFKDCKLNLVNGCFSFRFYLYSKR